MNTERYQSPSAKVIEIECQSIIAASLTAQQKQQHAQQQRQEQLAKEQAKKDALKEKYGVPTKSLRASWYDLNIYEEKGLVLIDNDELKFSDLVSCQLEKKVTQGKERLVEKEVPITLDHVVHNRVPEKRHHVIKDPDEVRYYVVLAVNKLSNPTYIFNLGDSLSKAMELKGLFDVIISRNNQ